jgi:hypothetical protein
MGRHRKRRAQNKTCEIKDCENDAVRSLPIKKVDKYIKKGAKRGVTKRVHICKEHYKEYKSSSKEDRKLDRLAYRDGGLDPQ